MPSNYTSLMKEWTPFAPDANGYCYLDPKHFKLFMQSVSKHLLIEKGRGVDRIPHIVLVVMAALFCLMIFFLFLNISYSFVLAMQIVMCVFFIWYFFRITRFVKTIIRQRMCFACGYSLRKTPTDENGHGRCSECGNTFHLGYYCHLPKGYKRRLPPSGIAMLAGSLPPIDIMRMQRDTSLQSSEDASPQPPPPGV